MARKPRIKVPGHAACYHVVTRTRGRGFLLDPDRRDHFTRLLGKLRSLYYVRYAAFAVLDNHYHLLLRFSDPEDVNSQEAMERWNAYHEDTLYTRNPALAAHRHYVVRELTDLSSFMKRFNLHMTLGHNFQNETSGTLWERRFRSSVVERGTATALCAAYIELNAFRASLVAKPEDYHYCSLYHLTRGTAVADLIDTDLLAEGLCDGKSGREELVRTYRAYVYAVGSRPRKGKEGGLQVSVSMREQLARHDLQPEKGSLSTRLNELINGKVTAGREFAQQIYEQHINPGLKGKHAEGHRSEWLTGFLSGLWIVCSLRMRTRLTRGSP